VEQLLCCRGRLWGCWVDAINTVGNTMSMSHKQTNKSMQSHKTAHGQHTQRAHSSPRLPVHPHAGNSEKRAFSNRSIGGVEAQVRERTRVGSHPFIIDELVQELSAPGVTGLNLIDYFNINPGLQPITVQSAQDSVFSAITPGLGPAGALAAGNCISNGIGFCARTAVQAVCYDKWRNLKLRVEFEPEVSGYAPSGQMGEIILHFEPNVTSGPILDVTTLLKSKFVAAGRVCDKIILDLPAAFAKKWYFLRSGPVTWGSSITDYDAGRVTVWTNGLQSGTSGTLMGRLWVRGLVEMFDDISPQEATCLQPFAPSSAILGMALAGLPTTSGSAYGSMINLINNQDLTGTALQSDPDGPGYYGQVVPFVVLTPGNYGIELYCNPTLAASVGALAGVGAGNLYCNVTGTNLTSGGTIILNDYASISLTTVGGSVNTVIQEQRPTTFRSFFTVAGGQFAGIATACQLAVSFTWSTASSGSGNATIAWTQVNNAYTGSAVNGTTLGVVLRIFKT
jgi:hypothetical protein